MNKLFHKNLINFAEKLIYIMTLILTYRNRCLPICKIDILI